MEGYNDWIGDHREDISEEITGSVICVSKMKSSS